jgi:hypothetical protein
MTDPAQPPRLPSWLAPAVVAMLGVQLLLSWLQGSLIHRQHKDLLALREDVQYLAEAMDQGPGEEDYEEEELAPARRPHPRIPRLQRIQTQPTEDEAAQKDLQDSRASGQRAVSQARAVQGQLSIEENIRKAEEKAKLEEAGGAWQNWLWAALGAGLVAVGVRAWLRRRG